MLDSYTKHPRFIALTPKEQHFFMNFMSTKTNTYETDYENFLKDLKLYGYKHQKYLTQLAETYLRQ